MFSSIDLYVTEVTAIFYPKSFEVYIASLYPRINFDDYLGDYEIRPGDCQ